jgi:segregation and condensation protein B
MDNQETVNPVVSEETVGAGEIHAQEAEAAPIEAEQLPELSDEELPAVVTALLLASGEPLTPAKIAEVCGVNIDDVALAIQSVQEWLERSCAGFEVVNVAGMYQFRTKAVLAPFIRQLKASKPRRLSPAALETLAIVAYRQPIVKSDIEKIRGVDCTPTMKTLLDRKMVKIMGHQQTVGQPALYGTSEEFLKVFGLSSLKELPNLKDIKEFENEPGETSEEPEAAAAQ